MFVWLQNKILHLSLKHLTLIENVFLFIRFHLYMHDQMKEKFLNENANSDAWKKDFIETISEPGYKVFAEMTTRRFIKTHLPFKLLPHNVMERRSKVVYVARNPKDVVVSFYHLNKLYRTQGYVNDFDTFFKYFVRDLCEYSSYFLQ